MIRDRLMREAEGNVAIRVTETENADAFEVAGRGELQLGVLIETMRREGFELAVGRPRVLFQTDPKTGQRLEPIEEVVIDVDDDYTGVVVEKMSMRKGELKDMRPVGRRQDPPGLLRPVARPDRLSRRVPDRHARHRRHEPPVPRLRPLPRPDRRPPQRRADRQRAGRGGGLCAVEPRGARPDVHRSRRAGLRGHDHRRAQPRQRPRRQPAEGQAAHQHPRRRQGRGRAADAAAQDDARAGDRLYRGRRAGRGDAQVDPPAQALPEAGRPQARQESSRPRKRRNRNEER